MPKLYGFFPVDPAARTMTQTMRASIALPHNDSANWRQIGGLSAIGSLAVLAIVGFVLGVNNNLFTLPIVADLYQEPQFAHGILRASSSG